MFYYIRNQRIVTNIFAAITTSNKICFNYLVGINIGYYTI